MSDDFMEIGDTGLVPCEDGWFYDRHSNLLIDPHGRLFDENLECIASTDGLGGTTDEDTQ